MVKLVTLENGNILNVGCVARVCTAMKGKLPDTDECGWIEVPGGKAWISTAEGSWFLVTRGDKEKIVAALEEMEAEREEKTKLLRDLLAQTVLELPSTISSVPQTGA